MQISANDFLNTIKIITDDYKAQMIREHDEAYNDFLDNCKDIDLRRVSDIDCSICDGGGIFTDHEDDGEGYQRDIPVICPCVEKNEKNVVKYWKNKGIEQ